MFISGDVKEACHYLCFCFLHVTSREISPILSHYNNELKLKIIPGLILPPLLTEHSNFLLS